MANNPWDNPGAAKSIDNYWQTSQLEQDWYAQLKSVLHYQLVPGNVMEVGCGSGEVHKVLDDSIEYRGCDISTEMLKMHRQRFPEAILYQQSDPYKLPIDIHFDNVLCISVLQHMENPEPLIPELVRVTKKKLIVITWTHGGKNIITKDAQGFYENIYNEYYMMELLLKPRLGTMASSGHLGYNNHIFCMSYGE